jgi:hypothetical protein
MAEDDDTTSTFQVEGLDSSDIRANIYEGGFKSWECAFDLAKLLLDRGPRKDLDDLCRVNHVVEVSRSASPVSRRSNMLNSSVVGPLFHLSFSSTMLSKNHYHYTSHLRITMPQFFDWSPFQIFSLYTHRYNHHFTTHQMP